MQVMLLRTPKSYSNKGPYTRLHPSEFCPSICLPVPKTLNPQNPGLGSRGLGFRGLGFRRLGFRGLGFRGLGVWGFRIQMFFKLLFGVLRLIGSAVQPASKLRLLELGV